jgi:hypothetical protein
METNQLLQQLGIRAGESVLADIHYVLTGRYKGQWSVTYRGIVVAHVAEAVLTGGVTARVNEVARQRVICGKHGNPICSHPSKDGHKRHGKRSVHAKFRGLWCPGQTAPPTANRISYNPYYSGSFHRYDKRTRGASVLSAPRVIFGRGGIAYI